MSDQGSKINFGQNLEKIDFDLKPQLFTAIASYRNTGGTNIANINLLFLTDPYLHYGKIFTQVYVRQLAGPYLYYS